MPRIVGTQRCWPRSLPRRPARCNWTSRSRRFTERDDWTDSDERWNDAYWHLLSLGYTPEEIGFNDEEVERVRALLAEVRR
jgi:hypothetical protein